MGDVVKKVIKNPILEEAVASLFATRLDVNISISICNCNENL